MIKKRWSFFVWTMAGALFLSACSNDSSDVSETDPEDLEGETVTVAVSEGDIGQFNAWEARSEEFTEETGIEVEFIGIPYDNLLDRITAEGISGESSFDLVTHLDVMGASINQFLEPLDDYAEADDYDFDRFPSSSLELSTFDGSVRSLPARANVQLLFYREDIFDDLGLEAPETWGDLEEAGNEITENTDLYGITPYYQSGNNGQNLYMWTSYLWSNGGDIFDENMKPIFKNQEGVEATQRYVDLLLEEEIAPPGSVTFGEQESRTHFRQGESAMWIGWWWVYSEFNSSDGAAEEVAGNVKFTTVPTWENENASNSNVSTFPIGMMETSENKAAAWEFLKWLTEPELERDIVYDSLTEESPSNQFSTDISQTENFRDEELNELADNFFNVGGDAFEAAKTLPTFPEWPQVSDILDSAINDMARGESVEDRLEEAAEDVEQLLEEEGYYE
ncbi:ABC transporter substrate-binding protein [Alteribacillus bidgolensis]|uniref:Multiple sugar transport system substrate-binding protein n=1 Tax=Alteribacillus bidgolensis TaxID=930129 RepID=A0A1G8H390_9BACI|nr:sugar ABC transporter substrate-binding protein [Alteribacillus bidgolensis]SDI01086.1 multiple sugar transport system substrate-binding protein [Alteribacillus bidgolensis]